MTKKPSFKSNEDISVRMYDNPILDKMSRVHFSVPIILFGPPILFFMFKSIWIEQLSALRVAAIFLVGCLTWTLTEYCIHRWVFHGEKKTKIGKLIKYTFHGIHHDYPKDSKRLVMVPIVSVPVAFLLYFAFTLVFGVWGVPLLAGFGLGYVSYDTMHFIIHHCEWRYKWFKQLQRYHLRHHFKDKHEGYGVSTPLWDYIFRTQFR